MVNREIIGKWFLPEFPDKLIFGKLTVEDGRSTLIIYGTFHEDFVNQENIKFICGNSNDGKEFTLYDCLFLSSERNLNEYQKTEYFVHYTLEGKSIFIQSPLQKLHFISMT